MERWLCSEETHLMGLREIEVEEEKRGRNLLKLLLQSHIDSKGNEDVGSAIQVNKVNTPLEKNIYRRVRRKFTRHITTIFGEIRVEKIGYEMKGKSSIFPLDAQLQFPIRLSMM